MTAGEDRAETLRVLVELAVADDPSSCFDGRRALRLLRSQTSPRELTALGVDEDTIKMIWPEGEDE